MEVENVNGSIPEANLEQSIVSANCMDLEFAKYLLHALCT